MLSHIRMFEGLSIPKMTQKDVIKWEKIVNNV